MSPLALAPHFTSIAHAYVHNIWFVCRKMQHSVVLGQVVQNSKMMYCIHNVHECPCQLHTISPQGDQSCSPFHIWSPCVTTLTLGSQPKQGLVKVQAKNEDHESHFMLLGVWESVREWTSTLPNELPLWELESWWTPKFS